MPARLLVRSKAETAEQNHEVVLAEPATIIGRDKACDLVLNNPSVSRKHLQVLREGGLYFLEDLNSSFGTRVNGVSLPSGEKRLLRNGDSIAVGPYDLAFEKTADVPTAMPNEKTSLVAKRLVKDALRGLSQGDGPCLRVMNGPLEGKRYELHEAQELIVGRDESADVRLGDDDLASRRHARLRRDWSGTSIEDLNSRNGIRVNKKRVKMHTLHDSDEVEVGSTHFLYLDPHEPRRSDVAPLVEAPPDPAESPDEEPQDEPAEESQDGAEEAAQEQEEEAPAEAEPGEDGGESAGEEGSSPDEQAAEGEEPPGEGAALSGEEEYDPGQEEAPPREGIRGKLEALLPFAPREMLPLIFFGAIAVGGITILAITFFVL